MLFHASKADIPGIAKVHVDCWRTTYNGIVPDEFLESLSYEKREKMWEEIFESKSSKEHVWVARKEGKVIGFCSGGVNRDKSLSFDGELYAIYLLKEHHKSGIGKKLFIATMEHLYRDGFCNMVLWVLETNPTRKFYESMGGKVVGEKREIFGGENFKMLAYGWEDSFSTLKKLKPEMRHPCIKHFSEAQTKDNNHYPNSSELLSYGSPLGWYFNFARLGIHHEILSPGRRTSWPHAEKTEDEFIFVIEGNPEVWIDGEVYQLKSGDCVGFKSDTGIAHTFINNTKAPVQLLVVGDSTREDNQIYYPVHPKRNDELKSHFWSDHPSRKIGTHPGTPG